MVNEAESDGRQPTPKSVGRVIIGHATDQTIKIWVQGSKRFPKVKLLVAPAEHGKELVTEKHGYLTGDHDYTACFDFGSLRPSCAYQVTAFFTHRMGDRLPFTKTGLVVGTFKTFPSGGGNNAEPFSFLLGSCNLPVVAINNLAAQALQLVGFYLAERSLERSIPDRQPSIALGEGLLVRLARWSMRQLWARWILRRLIHSSLGLVFLGTGGKWSTQPLLRSPFLKLAGMFLGHRIDFRDGCKAPLPGECLIGASSNASGVLAFEPILEKKHSWDGRDAARIHGINRCHWRIPKRRMAAAAGGTRSEIWD